MVADEDEASLHLLNIVDGDAARKTYEEIMSTVNMLDGSLRSYQRERSKRARAIVCEVYLGPRVTEPARRRRRKHGVEVRVALALAKTDNQWKPRNFNDPHDDSEQNAYWLSSVGGCSLGHRCAPLSPVFSRLASIVLSVRRVGATR